MALESFTRDDPIFTDESVLRDNYRPTELIERDDELAADELCSLGVVVDVDHQFSPSVALYV